MIFLFLIITRPSLPFLALLLIPIALAAVLYEFVGGVLVALIAMIGAALLLALDQEALRLAEVYADQAAIFIENARLLEELRQAVASATAWPSS